MSESESLHEQHVPVSSLNINDAVKFYYGALQTFLKTKVLVEGTQPQQQFDSFMQDVGLDLLFQRKSLEIPVPFKVVMIPGCVTQNYNDKDLITHQDENGCVKLWDTINYTMTFQSREELEVTKQNIPELDLKVSVCLIDPKVIFRFHTGWDYCRMFREYTLEVGIDSNDSLYIKPFYMSHPFLLSSPSSKFPKIELKFRTRVQILDEMETDPKVRPEFVSLVEEDLSYTADMLNDLKVED